MGEHSLDGPTDPAIPPAPTAVGPPRAVEAKLIVATVAATVLYAVLGAVQADTGILDPLPPWARTLILAVIPPLLALAAGYRTPSNRVSL